MRTVSPEDRYVAWARFNTHDGRSATTLHLCDSDAPGAFRVYRWEDVQDGAAREIKRLTAALERIRTGIAHDRCDGDSEFAAGVSAACRNHLELVNAAVAYGVMGDGTGEALPPVSNEERVAPGAEAHRWISLAERKPEPGALIVKRWKSGSVWAGVYSGSDKDSSFDEWVALPDGVAPDQPTRWCPECRSSGVVGIEQDVCPTCDGTGKVAASGVREGGNG